MGSLSRMNRTVSVAATERWTKFHGLGPPGPNSWSMLISVRVTRVSRVWSLSWRALFNPFPWSKNPIMPS